ncbi:hypothetical protein ACUWCL_28335, partial [Klebsiella pneumoniae]|uniref:hypothetical protein n=1 Tax=Klebsiella pneumoniae TaxID=573 RepID=UPI0040556E31
DNSISVYTCDIPERGHKPFCQNPFSTRIKFILYKVPALVYEQFFRYHFKGELNNVASYTSVYFFQNWRGLIS